jgi:hypothetical protein
MRLRRVFIWFHYTKTYDVGPGGGGGAGCEGSLGAGATGLGLNAFMNANICYSPGFSLCFAHALHPGLGKNDGCVVLVTYKKRTTNAIRRSHSHIYLLAHAFSCVIIPLNMTRRNSWSSIRTTAHLRRGPERTTRSDTSGFARIYASAHSQLYSGTSGVSWKNTQERSAP